MYDTIYIDDKIIDFLNKFFPLEDPLPKDIDWQTKDLENYMYSYYLKAVEGDTVKLYRLDPPNKNDAISAPFWREYTDEEIIERCNKPESLFNLHLEKGDGEFSNDAFRAQNRNHRDMGELPHQIIRVYTGSGVKSWYELLLKFTDGFLVGVKRQWTGAGFNVEKESEWIKVI
jgi:hypothetical protein